jgi:hypothetical protein
VARVLHSLPYQAPNIPLVAVVKEGLLAQSVYDAGLPICSHLRMMQSMLIDRSQFSQSHLLPSSPLLPLLPCQSQMEDPSPELQRVREKTEVEALLATPWVVEQARKVGGHPAGGACDGGANWHMGCREVPLKTSPGSKPDIGVGHSSCT